MQYISASRIHLYLQCPLSFKMKYIDGVADDEGVTQFYANYGKLFHEIAEGIAKEELSLVEADRKFDSDFSKCGIPDKYKPDYYKQGKASIAPTYEFLNEVDVLGVETNFNVSIDFTTPPIHGFIDLVYRDNKGRLIVVDWKTSKVYSNSELTKQYQPYFYSIACKHVFGEYPYAFQFKFPRFLETRSILIDEDFINIGKLKIKGIWNKIRKEFFEPSYSPFFCQNFCESASLCPMYLRKK